MAQQTDVPGDIIIIIIIIIIIATIFLYLPRGDEESLVNCYELAGTRGCTPSFFSNGYDMFICFCSQ